MDCPRCGTAVQVGRRFCGDCGSPLTRLCAACGGGNSPVSRYCGDCGAPIGTSTAESAPTARADIRQPAERRQVTVMFCDMADSTAVGARLDPEDLREVITAYHDCVTAQVSRFDGFIARYMGDGVLVYFGYPTAHEDDAERAVRAGLAASGEVERLNTIAGPAGTLRARVGIATGLVVVGDLIGVGASLEQTVVGDTPNLAARLQSLAEPGRVVIAHSTRRLLGRLFDYRHMAAIQIKGYSSMVDAWTVLRESVIDSRFEALRDERRLPLFGREDELAQLLRRWDQVKGGEGRAVLLTGDAGIGKSRLAAAVQERLAEEPHLNLRLACSPHHQNSALHPVIGHMMRDAGFEREDDMATRLRKLEALLAQTGTPRDQVILLSDLLSLPVRPENRLGELTPQQRRERTYEAILDRLGNLAQQHPTLVLIEDLHWADHSTHELLRRVLDQLERRRILLLITARPDLRPGWMVHPQVSVQLLNRLGPRQARAIIDGVSGKESLPATIREQILARADGVPLFIEELTRSVLESDFARGLDTDGAWIMPSRVTDVVPSSLQASLVARLDRLPNAKNVAQIAAVIGREFSFELFQSISHLERERLEHALQGLVQADLIVERGQAPDAMYSFRHALVQDAAYSSLLRTQRRTLHLQVAEALERHPLHAESAEPEILAHHFAEAGIVDKAVDHHLAAARQAASRCALAEMVSHLRRGLSLLADLPDMPATQRRELALQVALGQGLSDYLGSANDESHAAFARARALCLELKDTTLLLSILYGLQVYHFTRGESEVVLRYGQEILALSEPKAERKTLLLGERVVASAHLLIGHFAEARAAYERLLALCEATSNDSPLADSPRDSAVVGCSFLAICLTMVGYPGQGIAMSDRGRRSAAGLSRPLSLAFSLRRSCIQRMLLLDFAAVKELAEQLLKLAAENDIRPGRLEGLFFHSWALLNECNSAELHEQLDRALEQLDKAKTWAFLPYLMTAACELKLAHRDRDGGARLLARAAELVQSTGARWCQPEILRLRARLLGDGPEAPAILREAHALAQDQNAKLWQLRIAIALAQLLLQQGAHAAAHEILAPARAAFQEDIDFADLHTADALLAACRS
jgi:class 3 adenylate cyclase